MKQSTLIILFEVSILNLINCYTESVSIGISDRLKANIQNRITVSYPIMKFNGTKRGIFCSVREVSLNKINIIKAKYQRKRRSVLKHFSDINNSVEIKVNQLSNPYYSVLQMNQWTSDTGYKGNINNRCIQKTYPSNERYCRNNATNEIHSAIFTCLTFKEFIRTIEWNIQNKGDNLDQSHLTDLCGKYCVVRLWIKHDPAGYKNAMEELYFNGWAILNDGTILKVSESIVKAINSASGFTADPKQRWGTNKEFPSRTDMLMMLTLADNFHFRLGSTQPYSNADNFENSGFWAGSTIGAEIRLLKALGFEVSRYGDNFARLNKMNAKFLKQAVKEGSTVFLLVNSYKLNMVSVNMIERPRPGIFQKGTIGTHWISLEKMVDQDNFMFWEYGSFNVAEKGIWKTVCGGLVVSFKNEEQCSGKRDRLIFRNIHL